MRSSRRTNERVGAVPIPFLPACMHAVRLGRFLGEAACWLFLLDADVQFQTATRLGQPIVWGCFIVLRVGWFIFLWRVGGRSFRFSVFCPF